MELSPVPDPNPCPSLISHHLTQRHLNYFTIAAMVFVSQFQSPGPVLLDLGAITIRWYGLLIAMAVLIGVNLAQSLAAKKNINQEMILDLCLWLVVGAIPCARIYYVIFQWPNYADHPMEVFAIWKGGIAIHGAIIGGLLAASIFCYVKQVSLWKMLDTVAPSLILGQAIGRWGNFFNSEAFGKPTHLPWKLFIPIYARPEGYEQYAYFHPTFLYESLWNVGVFFGLLWLVRWSLRHQAQYRNGTVMLSYLVAYSLGRVWIEALRMDSLMVGPLKMAQAISLAAIALGILGLLRLYKQKKPLPDVLPSHQ
jgi:phosphatidylglycerol:prolipoprotein diacylglycerol transferase